ncbi:MAG: chloride channel protein [Bacteroidales bacterium]|jgi:CIC family chloride channel protein|nr:chloride channel protein [Bacteroidales bacterium]NLM92852.1 chloride channel protein [Bacteroidales bacterium]
MELQPWVDKFLVWRQKHLSDRNFLILLSMIIGMLAAVAAVALKTGVHYFEAWVRRIPGLHMENYFFLVFPLIGILVTVLFIRYFVRDDISHGVSRILYAISRNKGVMKLHNTWTSVVACTFTSGFGGSVGMEAPIVSTGAAIGSNLAQAARLGHKRTILLIGCGSAAAVAAIFKAPIAGLIFALEVLMLDLTMASIIPLLTAAVTGAIFSAFFLGEGVEFYFTLKDAFNYSSIPFYIILGAFTGMISLYFSWMNGKVEGRMKKIGRTWKRLLIGGLVLGVLIFLFPPLFGEGYFTMRSMLSGQPEQLLLESPFGHLVDHSGLLFIGFLVAVLFLKVVAMSLTTGAGGIGGVFAPSLFVGNIAGFIFARLINTFSGFRVSEYNFTLVGMAGLLAGVMHAPLTAIFLIAEITGGYELFIPLIITSSISYLTAHYFQSHSIYTKNLAARGELLTHDLDQNVLTLLNVESVIETSLDTVNPEMNLGELVKVIARSKRNIYPVLDPDNNFLGIVWLDDVREIMFDRSQYDELKVRNLMFYPRATVNLTDTMETVMQKFRDSGLWNMAVLQDGKYKGYVSRSNVFNVYRGMLLEFSEE